MNIAKLNTASLDDKTYIIKRGTSGGTTINNQDKVVDITENGTTEVVADGGYTGIGKVTINTEVSGGGESGSNIEYLDVSGMQGYMKNVLLYYSVLAKIQGDYVTYGVQIQPSGFLLSASGMISSVTAIAIDLVIPITKYASEESGVEKQELTTLDADSEFMEMLDTIPRLTKEQFYSLE